MLAALVALSTAGAVAQERPRGIAEQESVAAHAVARGRRKDAAPDSSRSRFATALSQHFVTKDDPANPHVRRASELRTRAQTRLNTRLSSLAGGEGSFGAGLTANFLGGLTGDPASPKGLPGFQLRPTVGTGGAPTSVASGDFNRDGHMDIVVANALDDNLWIYFGRGDGTFDVPRIIPLTQGLTPVGVVAADLRHTGVLDLVVADFDSWSIGVLLGNGDGTFSYEHSVSLPLPPTCVTVADFNGDGTLDIVAALDSNVYETPDLQTYHVATMFGDGKGNFGSPIAVNLRGAISEAWNIVAGDFNNDGLPDLITTGPWFPEGARLILNKGNGQFADAEDVYLNILLPANDSYAPTQTQVADVNGDGCLDALTSELYHAQVYVQFGDCAGHFHGRRTYALGGSPISLTLADVNGDGVLDALTTSMQGEPMIGVGEGSNNLLSVAMGDGSGGFGPPRVFRGTGPMPATVATDLNGDGKREVVAVSTDNDAVTVFVNDGRGGFGDPQGVWIGWEDGTVNNPDSYQTPTLTDVNGDGSKDFFFFTVVDIDGYKQLGVALNDGTGKFLPPIFSKTTLDIYDDIRDYRLADVRNTGRKDFIATPLNTVNTYIAFAPNLGNGSFGALVKMPLPNATGPFGIGDFNGDGYLDIAAQQQVFLGNGDGTFRLGAPIPYADALPASYVYVADVNHDGKLDVLMYSDANGGATTQDTLWEFLGNGDGTFRPGTPLFVNLYPFAWGDLNGDGSKDLLFYGSLDLGAPTNYGADTLTSALGRGDGSFAPLTVAQMPYVGAARNTVNFWQMGPNDGYSVLSDLRGVGKPDAIAFQGVAPGPTDTYAQILANRGDGTFAPTFDIFDLTGYTIPRFAADVNGDGRADLIELDGAVSSFHVLKATKAPALQLALPPGPMRGITGTGYVFLNTPSTGQAITLSSSTPGVTVPTSIVVPVGQLYAAFDIEFGSQFDAHRAFDVSAQLSGDTALVYGSHDYLSGFTAVLTGNDQTVYAGLATTPMRLTLASVNGYSSTVKLSCLGVLNYTGSCVFSPQTVTIPAGGIATATVVFQTNGGVFLSQKVMQVVASDGVNTRYLPFRVSAEILGIQVSGSSGEAFVAPMKVPFNYALYGIAPFQITCAGLPAGASCTFDSGTSVGAGQTGNFTVSLPPGLAAGNYSFQAVVTSQGLSASQTLSLPVVAALQPGWWWDPNLSGDGFFIEAGGKSGSGLFVGGFTYDASGSATWLVSTGQLRSSMYMGDWLKMTGGQTLLGAYRAPGSTYAGPCWITFIDSNHATMQRPGGGQLIQLQRFSFTTVPIPPPVAGAPQSGWWWAGSSFSGTGYGIEIQGNSVFIVAYVYDDAGNPVWYLATGNLATPTSYSGTWDVYAGGPQLTSPEGTYGATKVAGKSVPMSLTFSDATHGTVTMGGVTVPIVRFQEF